jgi:hypothetical protein
MDSIKIFRQLDLEKPNYCDERADKNGSETRLKD